MKTENAGQTGAWIFQVWASFAISSVATGVGILYLPIDAWMRAFIGLGFLFTMASCFSLAKTVRDSHEAERNGTPREAPRPVAQAAYRDYASTT